MKRNTLAFLLLIIGHFSYSQTFGGTDQTIAPIYFNLGTIEANKNYRSTFFKDVEGSPYIYKDFVLSEIEGIKSKMMLRYNAFDDVVEVEKAPAEIYTISKDPAYSIIYMNYGREKLRLVTFQDNKNEPGLIYAFELTNNKILALLRRDKIEFKEGKVARTSFELNSSPKFTSAKSTYLLEQKDKKIIEFPNSKAKLIDLYPSSETEIKSYLKKSKINFNDEKDLIATTQFLSSL
jgi:hypothetical protein